MSEILQGLAADKYFATRALSKSGLDKFKQSPAHYKAWLDGMVSDDPTPAMAFGSAFHCALLEPMDFYSRYKAFSGDRRTKAGKEDYEAIQKSGATIITQDNLNDILAMKQVIYGHPLGHKILSSGISEVSAFDSFDGVRVKARIDFVPSHPDFADALVDIKTTADASAVAFAKTAAQMRYHVQAAWYLRFFPGERRRFIFIAVEKVAPWECAVYEIDQPAIDLGNAEIDRQLELFKSCQEFNSWPGYSTQLQTLSLPIWAFKQDKDNQ